MLEVVVQAARLLGRWVMVAQRHGGGCSCCPGLGDVSMEEVERNILNALRERHPMLEGRENINLFMRELIAKRGEGIATPQALKAFCDDFDLIVQDLEKIQLGFY
jgi:hypothetical protein